MQALSSPVIIPYWPSILQADVLQADRVS